MPLFDIEKLEGYDTDESHTSTELYLTISKQATFNRAKTFFDKYSDIEHLADWFVDNFFPFFIENDNLRISVAFNGENKEITKRYIENNVTSILFPVRMEEEKEYDFKLWLVKDESKTPKPRSFITCFARHLQAKTENRKLEYEIDLPVFYDWYLTSEFFDSRVDQKGDNIDLSSDEFESIQKEITSVPDKRFAKEIEENRKKTKRHIETVRDEYNSLSVFIDDSLIMESKKIVKTTDLIKSAIENKGRIEKAYWTNQEQDDNDINKLLNSSLHIY